MEEQTFVSIDDWRKSEELRHRLDDLENLAEVMLANLKVLRGIQPIGPARFSFYEAVQQFEIELISDALKRTHGHQVKAARLLGLNVTTLNVKIKRYNILHADRELRKQIKSAAPGQNG
jgi:transcriptional regulator with GAF, ATPase, and Fis domain